MRMSGLERQLSSPGGPVRHLSGDSGGLSGPLQHQPPPFSRAGRHQSGGEVRLAAISRDSQQGLAAPRRASGDSSLQRFSLGGPAGDTFTVVSQEAPGSNIIRTSVGTQVVR